MKNLIAFLVYCLSVSVLLAQSDGASRLEILSSTQDETILRFDLTDVQQNSVQTPNGMAVTVGFEGGTPLLMAGAPDVQKYAFMLRLPASGAMAFELVDGLYTDLPNVEVAPSKGDLKRTVDPATVPYTYGTVYQEDKFFPDAAATLKAPFIMRAARGQALWLNPVQYNPVSKTLRVYHSMTIRVYNTHETGENQLPANVQKPSRTFDQMFSKLFVNNPAFSQTRSADEPEKMLVIANDDLLAELGPLVEWKRQMGIHTTVVPVSEAGGPDAANVYNFVKDYYDAHAITYLLLVGDENAIHPEMRQDGDFFSCDNCFGYMDGADHFPEVLVGRFNASSLTDLRIMVNRNLDYEKTPLVDTLNNWTATAMASCSNEGAGIGDDNQADWEQGNEWKTAHLADGFDKIWEFYDGSHGALSPTPGDISADANGNPINTQLVQLMNNRGVGLYNYCGHGWEQGLVSGNFNTDAVAQLRNIHRYPIVVAVACCAGNFTNNSGGNCLGEAIQRAGDANTEEAWGSIAGFFSSDFQSWAPPMEGQDGMNQFLIDADGISLDPNIGAMATYGNALMIAAYDNGGELMADFWNPFAEPTTVPRTRMAQALSFTTVPGLFIGATSLLVSSEVEGATVALYWEGQTLAVAQIENGIAFFNFPPLNNVGNLTVTVTQFNYTPSQIQVPVTPSSGPFVINQLIQLNDVAGNNNQKADYNETLSLDLKLANVGVALATATGAVLTSNDPQVEVLNGEAMFGDLNPDEALLVPDAFTFLVKPDAEDGHIATFNINISYSDSMSLDVAYSVTLHAPVLLPTLLKIDDSQGGNNNKRFDSGETVKVTIYNKNSGSSASTDALATLSSSSPYLSISAAQDLGPLNIGATNIPAVFTVQVSDLAPQNAEAYLDYGIQAGSQGATQVYGPYLINALVEDFVNPNFNAFPWGFDGDKPWAITTYQPYAGAYCSRSGTIGANAHSDLNITLDVTDVSSIGFARKVSSEENHDFLRFYIDSVEIDAWSGILGWEALTYPVEPGIHQFSWVYSKDDIGSAGSDRAYLDDIYLPPYQLVVDAGNLERTPFSASVSPNPAADRAVLNIQLSQETMLLVNVYDNLGRLVQSPLLSRRQSAGTLYLPIDLQNAAPGVYFIQVQTSEASRVLRLVH